MAWLSSLMTPILLMTCVHLTVPQPTHSSCVDGTAVLNSVLRSTNSGSCCEQLNSRVEDLRKDVRKLKEDYSAFVHVDPKGAASNPGRSCRDIRQSGSTESGVYWINPDPDLHPFPLKVFCEMQLLGGGWLRVYNFIGREGNNAAAAEMFLSIKRNAAFREVLANTSTSAILTRGLRLQEYTQALFGWAASETEEVSHYGLMTSPDGLRGVCYIDGYCGANQRVGVFVSSVTGISQELKSGSDPSYPHVGLGYSGQVIVWGYDRNAKQLSSGQMTHWGNWNDDQPCCNVGATDDMGQSDEWRYAILIR